MVIPCSAVGGSRKGTLLSITRYGHMHAERDGRYAPINIEPDSTPFIAELQKPSQCLGLSLFFCSLLHSLLRTQRVFQIKSTKPAVRGLPQTCRVVQGYQDGQNGMPFRNILHSTTWNAKTISREAFKYLTVYWGQVFTVGLLRHGNGWRRMDASLRLRP